MPEEPSSKQSFTMQSSEFRQTAGSWKNEKPGFRHSRSPVLAPPLPLSAIISLLGMNENHSAFYMLTRRGRLSYHLTSQSILLESVSVTVPSVSLAMLFLTTTKQNLGHPAVSGC